MEVVLMVALLIGGLAIGYLIGRQKKKETLILGTLQIDHSDPDMPYLFLLNYDLDHIATQKQATFDVKVENFISHK